jgi:hypothetical protein
VFGGLINRAGSRIEDISKGPNKKPLA